MSAFVSVPVSVTVPFRRPRPRALRRFRCCTRGDSWWSASLSATVRSPVASWNHNKIWVRSRNCGCLFTWFCYQLIAKPGNKTATVSWPDPYTLVISFFHLITIILIIIGIVIIIIISGTATSMVNTKHQNTINIISIITIMIVVMINILIMITITMMLMMMLTMMLTIMMMMMIMIMMMMMMMMAVMGSEIIKIIIIIISSSSSSSSSSSCNNNNNNNNNNNSVSGTVACCHINALSISFEYNYFTRDTSPSQ